MTTEINVCMGSACYARGNDKNIEYIEKYISENNLDAKFEITASLCNGCCADGPNIFINGELKGNMTLDKVKELMAELSKNE
ncbi:(2Fe-2S) ferredoxin domain-containing protein [bacterium]|nr:(2Fe-2S) ferredoxin domain-containing protein [bacterium]